MKNFKLTIFSLLITTTTAFAQIGNPDISDKWTISEYDKYEVKTEGDEKYTVKHHEITEEYTPVILDPKDKYKINQDIIYMPTHVSKTIELDYNHDVMYDKKVTFNYKKPDETDLNFTLSKSGIVIISKNKNLSVEKVWNKLDKTMYSNALNERIKNEGTYVVALSNGEKIDITITNYDIF